MPLEREGDYDWDRQIGRRELSKQPGFSDRSTSHGLRASKGRWPRSIVASDGIDGFQYFILSRTRGGHSPIKTRHPNQKPLELMRWIVSKFPEPGVIFDPYAGSGTTLEAALLEGFEAWGCEQNPGYFAIAERRIEAAKVAQSQLLPLIESR